jgi:hypothetical protein
MKSIIIFDRKIVIRVDRLAIALRSRLQVGVVIFGDTDIVVGLRDPSLVGILKTHTTTV